MLGDVLGIPLPPPPPYRAHGRVQRERISEDRAAWKVERLDLTVAPYPQDFSLLTSRGALRVEGSFRNPEFSAAPGLPSPDLGLAEDSPRCQGFIAARRAARTQPR